MPIFEYKAIDGDNRVKKGIIDADTPRDARIKLKKDRLFVVHDNVFFNQHNQVICSGRGQTIRPA